MLFYYAREAYKTLNNIFLIKISNFDSLYRKIPTVRFDSRLKLDEL
jgi:hypothetical protein